MLASTAREQDNPLIGIWVRDEGFQIVELLFRSDGRYHLRPKGSDPVHDSASNESGQYQLNGQTLTLLAYKYTGERAGRHYEAQITGSSLTLTSLDLEFSLTYEFKTGSKADVLARETVDPNVARTWGRRIVFHGREECTFRPDGYYFIKDIPEGFPPQFIRGRYAQEGTRLSVKPYGGIEVGYELDFFGNELTLITVEESRGDWKTYEEVPGSKEDVRAKTAEAQAFLSREHWHVGVWEIRDAIHTVDLTIRPDGRYIAKEDTESLSGIVRGRYTLQAKQIHLLPFVGQALYARSNGEFGKVERTRALDYYEGELQFIDLDATSQSVTLARKRPGSQAAVLQTAEQAHATRQRNEWYVGIWEVHDPVGWMELTFRPDGRYIAKSGAEGVPSQVERGHYVVGVDKVTLAPYPGLGQPRGFGLDLYDGDLFLVGDMTRMVVARKVPNSEADVIEKARDPRAMQGERGSILGLWTANLPWQSTDLVFRPDGQFRVKRCSDNVVSYDYGLYGVDMATRTLVWDSRFVAVQTRGLDFYGDTSTIFGGLGPPTTYSVNLGVVDAAIGASFAADAEEGQVDAQWLRRVPMGPRDPKAVQIPTGDIPADPNPERVFEAPAVFTKFQFYRRLIPGFVYFYEQGTIKSVPVVNTSEWYFFPTGRTLVRFRNYRAGVWYPQTIVDLSDTWGAYRLEPRPNQRDVLHIYADNVLFIQTDGDEHAELTLEDGRRHLFWEKDFQILSEWASEQRPVRCHDVSLISTGVSLATAIKPDEIGD